MRRSTTAAWSAEDAAVEAVEAVGVAEAVAEAAVASALPFPCLRMAPGNSWQQEPLNLKSWLVWVFLILPPSLSHQSHVIPGSIAITTRSGDCPTVLAVGASAINQVGGPSIFISSRSPKMFSLSHLLPSCFAQAVKSLIVAKMYLKDDNIDFSTRIVERRDIGPNALQFVLTKKPLDALSQRSESS